MYNILIKYKKLLLILAKWLIVVAACYFIYIRLVKNNELSLEQLSYQMKIAFGQNIWILLFTLLLTDANWLAEIHKWKVLISAFKRISFMESFEQCLAAMTVSIITPNRIGEYGAKVLYYKKENRKKVVMLTLVGNLMQLGATLLFGIIGVIIVLNKYDVRITENQLNTFIWIVLFGCIFYLIYRYFNLFGIRSKLQQFPKRLYIEIFGLSILRYLFFSHQFYLICSIFGMDLSYTTAMPLIFSTYLVASLIPALALFDWAIKGSIAVLLFSLVGVNEILILSVTTVMWLLNFAIPALLGSFFVINHTNNPEQ